MAFALKANRSNLPGIAATDKQASVAMRHYVRGSRSVEVVMATMACVRRDFQRSGRWRAARRRAADAPPSSLTAAPDGQSVFRIGTKTGQPPRRRASGDGPCRQPAHRRRRCRIRLGGLRLSIASGIPARANNLRTPDGSAESVFLRFRPPDRRRRVSRFGWRHCVRPQRSAHDRGPAAWRRSRNACHFSKSGLYERRSECRGATDNIGIPNSDEMV